MQTARATGRSKIKTAADFFSWLQSTCVAVSAQHSHHSHTFHDLSMLFVKTFQVVFSTCITRRPPRRSRRPRPRWIRLRWVPIKLLTSTIPSLVIACSLIFPLRKATAARAVLHRSPVVPQLHRTPDLHPARQQQPALLSVLHRTQDQARPCHQGPIRWSS